MNKILIDTNVLIYAHDSTSPFFDKSFKYIENTIITNKACLSIQNYLEAYRIWTQKIKKPISASEAWLSIDYYRNHPNVTTLYPTLHSFDYCKKLTYTQNILGVNIFDVQLIATMLEYEVHTVATVNTKDFEEFKEIKVVNPLK